MEKLIKTKDKFILVSDETIENCYVYDFEENVCYFWNKPTNEINTNFLKSCKKIIAGITDLPSVDFSDLKEKDCKEIGWVDVEKLALEKYLFPLDVFIKMKKCSQNDYLLEEEFGLDLTTKYREILGFIKGFKTAQSLNDKMFSLDDMHQALHLMNNSSSIPIEKEALNIIAKIEEQRNDIIQSLQQTEWDVEVEMEYISDGLDEMCQPQYSKRIKITNGKIKVTKIKK